MTWNWKTPSLGQRVLAGLLIVFAASAFRVLFFSGLGEGIPYLVYYPATMLAALYGGLATGFLATVLSALLVFFWIEHGELSPPEWLGMGVYVASCLAITIVCELLRRTRKRIEDVNRNLQNESIEREHVAEVLAASEVRYRRLFESAKDGILILDAESGMVVDVNPFMVQLLGVTREVFLNKKVWELGFLKDLVANEANFAELRANEYIRYEDMALEGFDGKRHEVEFVSNVYLVNHHKVIQCNIRDISERKRTEAKLEEEAARRRVLFEECRDGIVVMDRDGKVCDANRRYAEMLGYSSDEVLRLHVWDWDTQWTQAQLLDMIRSTDNSGLFIETRHRRKDGSIYDVELASNRMHIGGQDFVFCICRDVTARKQAEGRDRLAHAVLQRLNRPGNLADMIRDIITLIKASTGFDAVGLRLREGDDFPYYFQTGFSNDFLKTENTLAVRDEKGGVCTNQDGSICLECTCGVVLSGKTDPANPLFTQGGSAWTNNSIPLLDIPPDQDPRLHPRNRCVHEGYLSVALIPLRAGNEIIGMLQLNDRRANQLSPEMVRFFERVAASIAIGLKRAQAEHELREKDYVLLESERLGHVGSWFYDPHGPFKWSEEMYRLYGVSPDTFTPTAESFLGLIHPDDRPAMQSWLTNCAAGAKHELVFRVNRPDGTTRIILGRGEAASSGENQLMHMAGTAQDITERMVTEEELRRSADALIEAQRVGQIGSWEWDIATDTIRWSEQIYRLFSIDPGTPTPGYIKHLELFAAESGERLDRAVKEVMRTGTGYDLDLELAHPSGQTKWVHVRGEPQRNVNGLICGLRGTTQNITAYKQTEAALETANQALRRTLQELQTNQAQMLQQARLSALGQLASGIAHDFNNALMPILGYSELLLSRPEMLANREKTVAFITRIVGAAEDAQRIVSRLRLIHQPDQLETFMPVDLADVAQKAMLLTAPRWDRELGARGIRIRVETTIDPAILVLGDAAQLREALMNLILNAVDAMPQGGSITLSAAEQAGDVVLSVADTGIGMSEEVKAHCLEAFYTTKGAKGSGLGLAMVAGIVKRHQGTLEIDSAPGCGTTIRLRLPAILAGEPTANTASEKGPADTIASGLRILLAEDDATGRELLDEYLKLDGHAVETAQDGREAMDKASKGTYDLVITDRAMFGASGDDVARAAKTRNPTTPVILLTGFGDLMHDAGECPAGVDLVLGKPVTHQTLQQAICKVMLNPASTA